MEKSNSLLRTIVDYSKNNWFKIGLVVFTLLLIVKKDFTFQFYMNTPEQQESPVKNNEKIKSKAHEPSALTDASKDKKTRTEEMGIMNSIGSALLSSKPKNELTNVEEDTKIAYLKRFAHVAVSERKKFGIPSSIILANGLFHSLGGKSPMSQSYNNHFEISCTDWRGKTGIYDEVCYRSYENAWMSFRNHSEYITTGQFASLKKIGSTNYKEWAKALEKQGFSKYDNLAEELIKIIKQYNLDELDTQS